MLFRTWRQTYLPARYSIRHIVAQCAVAPLWSPMIYCYSWLSPVCAHLRKHNSKTWTASCRNIWWSVQYYLCCTYCRNTLAQLKTFFPFSFHPSSRSSTHQFLQGSSPSKMSLSPAISSSLISPAYPGSTTGIPPSGTCFKHLTQVTAAASFWCGGVATPLWGPLRWLNSSSYL